MCSGAVGLEQLDKVARWVTDQRLAPAAPVDHSVHRFDAGTRQRRQVSVEVVDAQLDPVPAAGYGRLACDLPAGAAEADPELARIHRADNTRRFGALVDAVAEAVVTAVLGA